MARPKNEINLPHGEAKFILEALYRDGIVSRDVLARYRERYGSEVEALESRLAHLRALAAGALPVAVGAMAAAAVPAAVRAARKARVTSKRKSRGAPSAERLETRKLQGRYLGLLRQIPTSMKKRFGKAAIASKGKDAVVAEMQSYLDSQRKTGKK